MIIYLIEQALIAIVSYILIGALVEVSNSKRSSKEYHDES
jgi:hypothetical protein